MLMEKIHIYLPDLRAFWDDVERHRKDGTKPESLPSKVLTVDL